LRGAGLPVSRVERGMRLDLAGWPADAATAAAAARLLHDPMTQSLLDSREGAQALFAAPPQRPLERIALAELEAANRRLGLALAPSDVALMRFAQANSAHCRHRTFNASWTIDGTAQARSLFAMIRNTHHKTPHHTLSAYRDNAAVTEGHVASRYRPDPASGQ